MSSLRGSQRRDLACTETYWQASQSMWSCLRRIWAVVAIDARERGNAWAAAQAERELIRCEIEWTRCHGPLRIVGKRSPPPLL